MGQKILARWYTGVTNIGDVLTPLLIEHFAGVKPVNVLRSRFNFEKIAQRLKREPSEEYVCVGSILGWGDFRDEVACIWGAGFMTASARLRYRPKEIFALRGKLTAKHIDRSWMKNGVAFGDPGLLISEVYTPNSLKSIDDKKVAIVPHYKEKNVGRRLAEQNARDFVFLDIQGDSKSFVEQLVNCSAVLSSSLHGIVLADAFEIPATWVDFGNPPAGQGFKFLDYFSAVNRKATMPVPIKTGADLRAAFQSAESVGIKAVKEDLLASCPFAAEQRSEWNPLSFR